MPYTAKEVAEWMVEEFKTTPYLYQNMVASQIRSRFGEEFIYTNQNGNWAIRKDVLAQFRKLSPPDTVWSRSSQYWRKRESYDPPGKRMVS